LQDAHLALADANTALGNRMDVEELFAPIVKLTGRLLTQLDTELGKLEALVPLTPTVAKRLVALQRAVKPHGQTQTALEAARAKTALASKAGNLADLIKDMNSLADDAEKLIKDAPDLRNTFLTKAMEEFYEDTVKANLKDFVSARDIKLPKALKTATDTAAGSGWTAGAIKTAEKDLSDKIKAKIDTLHLAAVEVINVRALGTDNAYRFLTGSIAEANDLARTTGMTVALARQAMNAKLAAQKTPKREKWAAYISRSGINKKSFERTGGGGAYVIHMTILNSNVIAANPDVNIDTDDVYAAAEKIFGISPSTMQNHVTIEAPDGIGGLNKYHLYIGAKKPTGKPDAVQGKALQDAMKWWIDTFFAPVYKRVKDVEGGFHLL